MTIVDRVTMAQGEFMAASVFFSYSHVDEALRDQVETQLALLKRQGVIETWHDRRIGAGEEFAGAIEQHVETDDIILLLVSADFIASDYCYDVEMKRALERQQAGDARVIPVILRACDWKQSPFGGLKAVPHDGKPVTAWPDVDEAFSDIVAEVRRAIEQKASGVRATSGSSNVVRSSAGPSSPVPRLTQETVRSSNLAIKKQYTEHAKDQFLHTTFEYFAAFFENSLNEIKSREPDVQASFRRIDANTFSAVTYRNGALASRCAISIADTFHSRGSIQYSLDSGHGFNESLHVEADDNGLFLRAMGFSSGQRREQQLTQRGGAELYWDRFIEPLQRR
jgi:TIR domain-containing protein